MKNELTQLEELSAADIEEKLPAFFAYDLQQIIKKNEIELCCLFIDTYEVLWENANNESAKDLSDAWVRELISNLDSVLFIICSREKFGWGKREPDWDDVLDQHLLGGLERSNAREFLVNCGLNEDDIVEKILDASEGHPYSLDLSVDTYFELKNKSVELKPEHFGSNRKEILERFVKYLDRIEVETLKIMSVPNFYNFDIFKYLLAQINVGFPISAYKDFNMYSFISEINGIVTIHNLMREGLVTYIDQEILLDVHGAMVEYYTSKLNNSSYPLNYDQKKIAFRECIYHSVRLKERSAFFEWLNDKKLTIKQYQLFGEAGYLRNILSDIFKKVGYENVDMQIFNALVDMVHLTGDYEESVRISEKVLNQSTINDIKLNKELLQLKIRSIHHKMFYLPVDELIYELKQIEKGLATTIFVEEYNEVLFMLGGNLGVLSGDFNDCRTWLIKSMQYSEMHQLSSLQCRNLRKWSDLLRIEGEFDEALECCERGIKLCEEFNYERYKLYLLCTKAEISRLLGNYEECFKIINDVDIMVKKMGIKGWEGHVKLLKAIVHYDLGKYSEAADYARNARYISRVWRHFLPNPYKSMFCSYKAN